MEGANGGPGGPLGIELHVLERLPVLVHERGAQWGA
jgi:hypothetical protein